MIGAFVSKDYCLKNFDKIKLLRDKFGLEYLHTHAPVVGREENYPRGYIPPPVEKEKVEEFKRDFSKLKENGFKILLTYAIFNQAGLLKRYPKYAAISVFGNPHDEKLCPSNPEVHRIDLGDIGGLVETYEPDGIVLDYIRFESPMGGLTRMFTCFCENCMKDMKDRGYNPYKIKRDVVHFIRDIRRLDSRKLSILIENSPSLFLFTYGLVKYSGLLDFIQYRIEVIGEFLDIIYEHVKNFSSKIMVLACVLSPWWSIFAGQDYYRLSQSLDILEPMLYHDWILWEGTTFVQDLAKGSIGGLKDLYTLVYKWIGLYRKENFEEILTDTLEPEDIKRAIQVSKILAGSTPVIPVLMTNKINITHKYLKKNLSNLKRQTPEFLRKIGEAAREAKGLTIFTIRENNWKNVVALLEGFTGQRL